MKKKSKIERYTDQEALDYHNSGKSGKIEILSSKPMTSKRDLALAYSPGVAAPVKVIAENPDAAYDYTTKGNLVAVISNGSAILGLGNLGALASKPVMEGKAILFKRFADIDSIDLEIDSSDSAVSVDLNSQGLYVVGTVSSSCEIRQVELNLIPSLIQSHRHGANEWLDSGGGLIVRGSESSSYALVIKYLHLESEVLLQVLNDHDQERELNG